MLILYRTHMNVVAKAQRDKLLNNLLYTFFIGCCCHRMFSLLLFALFFFVLSSFLFLCITWPIDRKRGEIKRTRCLLGNWPFYQIFNCQRQLLSQYHIERKFVIDKTMDIERRKAHTAPKSNITNTYCHFGVSHSKHTFGA